MTTTTNARPATLAVVRFGQSFYVVGFPERYTAKNVTRDVALKYALAEFAFSGPATGDNPDAVSASAKAQAAARRLAKENV